MTSSSRKVVCMFRIKFPTKRIFQIFPILSTDGMAPFCNLFMERPSYYCNTIIPSVIISRSSLEPGIALYENTPYTSDTSSLTLSVADARCIASLKYIQMNRHKQQNHHQHTVCNKFKFNYFVHHVALRQIHTIICYNNNNEVNDNNNTILRKC